jgi:hypothetical protein
MISSSGKFKSLFYKSSISVINPSVVTDTQLPPSFCILWRHYPITLLTKAVLHDASMGLDKSVPVILKVFPVRVSNDILLEIPLTTFP